MIQHDSKDWFRPVFLIHKSDTFRKLLPMLLFMAAYSAAVVYLEKHHFQLTGESPLKHLGTMHSLLGFAISMLLVFRTNTAYDRWWEGRKLWGSLVNGSRNFALKLQAFLPEKDAGARAFFRQAIPLYAASLQQHLLKETTRLSLDEQPHPELPNLDGAKHVPNAVAGSIIAKVEALRKSGALSMEQFLALNEELRNFTDVCGACERIKNTPIPYSYSAFIKKFIVIYVVTLPIGLAFSLGWLSVLVTTFIFYVLASLELIAEEIEDPFGRDGNDLPMARIAETIKWNVRDILM